MLISVIVFFTTAEQSRCTAQDAARRAPGPSSSGTGWSAAEQCPTQIAPRRFCGREPANRAASKRASTTGQDDRYKAVREPALVALIGAAIASAGVAVPHRRQQRRRRVVIALDDAAAALRATPAAPARRQVGRAGAVTTALAAVAMAVAVGARRRHRHRCAAPGTAVRARRRAARGPGPDHVLWASRPGARRCSPRPRLRDRDAGTEHRRRPWVSPSSTSWCSRTGSGLRCRATGSSRTY